MATVSFSNAPDTLLNMNDFKSVSEMYGSLARSARFLFHIKPRGFLASYNDLARQLIYLCEAAEMPGRSFINVDVSYYGPNQKLPVKTQYEDMNVTFLCRNKSFEREFFDNWQLVINPVNTYDFNYRDDYACEIDIYQYSDVGIGVGRSITEPLRYSAEYCITLMDAYPVMVNPQPMTWQDDMVQRLVINFTYTKWKRKGIDPEPRIGAPNGFSFNLVESRQVIR